MFILCRKASQNIPLAEMFETEELDHTGFHQEPQKEQETGQLIYQSPNVSSFGVLNILNVLLIYIIAGQSNSLYLVWGCPSTAVLKLSVQNRRDCTVNSKWVSKKEIFLMLSVVPSLCFALSRTMSLWCLQSPDFLIVSKSDLALLLIYIKNISPSSGAWLRAHKHMAGFRLWNIDIDFWNVLRKPDKCWDTRIQRSLKDLSFRK